MRGEVDLHVHSNRSSDGDFSPFHLIQLARGKKLKAISITDHDTLAAYPEALEMGKKAGVEVIPGVELTTIYDGREFHLLLLFLNWKSKTIPRVLSTIARRRIEEARERVKKLQRLGFDIGWKEVKAATKSIPPLGVVIAQVLLEKSGKKEDKRLERYLNGKDNLLASYMFYRDFFTEGKAAYVPKRNISLVALLGLIPEIGGVPVLAHPGAYFQKVKEKDISSLREKGLEGLEVYTPYHDSKQIDFYKKLAEKYNLIATAGSDFHGRIKPHIPFGSAKNGDYAMVEALRQRRK